MSEEEKLIQEAAEKYLEGKDWRNFGSYNQLENTFKEGVKFHRKRSYSKEEVLSLFKEWEKFDNAQDSFSGKDDLTFEQWIKQFKKKQS